MKLTTRQKMTAARMVQRPVLAARRLTGRGAVTTARRGGARWTLDLREGIDFAIWLRGYFEPSTVSAYRRLLAPGATVLDIGANIGAHTLHLARAVGPAGRVVAFEPTESALQRLAANVRLNPDLEARIGIHQLMLLASDDEPLPDQVVSSWPLLPRHELHAIVPGRPQATTGAEACSLDRALADLGVDDVDLVKLDVDGYECDVLDGAQATLARHRPLILSELAPFVLEEVGRDVRELVERFDDHGYELWDLKGERRVDDAQIDELSREHASANVLARPRGRNPA